MKCETTSGNYEENTKKLEGIIPLIYNIEMGHRHWRDKSATKIIPQPPPSSKSNKSNITCDDDGTSKTKRDERRETKDKEWSGVEQLKDIYNGQVIAQQEKRGTANYCNESYISNFNRL